MARFLTMSLHKVRTHFGDSAARQIAYVCRTRTIDPRTGRKHDFRKLGPAEATGRAGWDGTTGELIAAATFSERRKKAVQGRVIVAALPHELSRPQRFSLVRDFAEYLVRTLQVAVVWAIHAPPRAGNKNWHSHFYFSSREVVDGKTLGRKTRQLDSFKTGGKIVEATRAWWCATTNAALRDAGFVPDVEHRSYKRLREQAELDGSPDAGPIRKPGRHLGERRAAIARRLSRGPPPSTPRTDERSKGLEPLPVPEMPRKLQPLPVPAVGAPAKATLPAKSVGLASIHVPPAASGIPANAPTGGQPVAPEPGPRLRHLMTPNPPKPEASREIS